MGMPPSIVRAAQAGDAAGIAAVHVASWKVAYRGYYPDHHLDALTMKRWLPGWKRRLEPGSDDTLVLVADSGNEITGFSVIEPAPAPDDFELSLLYVHPGHMRRGIGRSLLQQAEQEMRARGGATAILWVIDENARARRFYEAMGWRPDGAGKTEQVWDQDVHQVRYVKRLGETH
jgi:ribosomal protein S18 acetylase RimI-like enzyme